MIWTIIIRIDVGRDECDLIQSIDIRSFVVLDTHSPKKSDRNSIQTRQLILHNEQLQLKCDDLQMKLEQLERKNLHLIQRLTERVIDQVSFIEKIIWWNLCSFFRIFVH